MTEPKSCYRPIASSREFRILHLRPGRSDDVLVGKLEYVALDAKPSYEALSYEWGSAEREKEIILDSNGNFRLGITRSLYDALRDLRHEDASSAPRAIWADGVCINQDDVKEREQQVSIMGSIYHSALRVITYIGPHADDSDRAIDFAYELLRSCGTEQDRLENAALSLADRTVPSRKLPPTSDPRYKALRKVLLRGWAGRCWCAQEFLLNSNQRMMCGRREINEWDLLPNIIQHVFNRSLPSFLLPHSSEDPNSLRECLVTLLHTRVGLYSQQSHFKLLELLSNFHPLLASDPRDKVYSLLGLASDRNALDLPIDYTCTVQSLYTLVATRIISMYQPIDILYSNLGIKNVVLPSWVPDWSKWRFGTGGMTFDYTYCASGSTLPNMRVVDGDVLEIAGCLFDKLTYLTGRVGPRFTRAIGKEVINDKGNGDGETGETESEKDLEIEQDREDILPTHEWLAAHVELLTQRLPYPDGSSSPLEVLWRTLTSNITRDEETAGADYVAYYNAHLALCHRYSTGKHSLASYRSPPPLTRTDATQKDMAYNFRDNARRRMRYRRLCMTSKHYFGSVPEEARIGDWVCLIEGARSMFVLRDEREEKGGFRLLGPSYVHGLMNGEFLQMDAYEKGMIRLI